MKKFSFLALAAVGLLLGACSSKDDVAEVSERETTQYDQAFIGISIELPSSLTPTRANDELNNGEEDEFAVKDARLLLFKGATEATATFVLGSSLQEPTEDWEEDDQGEGDPNGAVQNIPTKVTSSKLGVAKIEDLKLLGTDKLYGYVILNRNGHADPQVGTTFQAWADEQWNSADLGYEYDSDKQSDVVKSNFGLMMTNAPIVQTKGGSDPSQGPVITAVNLTKNIMKTEAEAIAAPAGCIFVERAAAKLTVSATGASTTLIAPGTEETLLSFEVNGFQVINTEPKFYNTRHVEEGWLGWNNPDYHTADYSASYLSSRDYRFVSVNKFAPTRPGTTGHLDAYRTFFAKDIQYDAEATGLVNPVADVNGNWIAVADGVQDIVPKAYMPENTFDVEHQTFKNTTCATIKVTFNNGANLWSIKNDDKLYTDATINGAVTEKVQQLYEVDQWVTAAYNELAQKYSDATGTSVTVTANVTAELNDMDAAGEDKAYTVSCEFTRSDGQTAAFSDLSNEAQTQWATVKAAAEADFKVNLYANGVSYYNVRIQHFGEYETPWNKIPNAIAQADTHSPFKIQPGENVEQIYGYRSGQEEISSKRFLGRYGVVRDNWYKLEIGEIKKLGTPNPKTVSGDGTPDDQIEEEFWISAHVHIVPWVLRTQSVSF